METRIPIEKGLEYTKRIDAPKSLENKVFLKVHKEILFRLRMKVLVTISVFTVSFASLIQLSLGMVREVRVSGIVEYIQILTSDIGYIGMFWKEALLVLLEALPVFSIMSTLSVLLIVIFLLRIITNTITTRRGQLLFI